MSVSSSVIPSVLVMTTLLTVLAAGVVLIQVPRITNSCRWIRRKVPYGSILGFQRKMATSKRKTIEKKRSLLQTVP